MLIAYGIGIAPLKSMAHALAAQGADFGLHLVCRSRNEAPFLGQLTEAFGARVVVHADDEPERIDVPALMSSVGTAGHVYVCGPQTFNAQVLADAEAAGIPAGHVHAEELSDRAA